MKSEVSPAAEGEISLAEWSRKSQPSTIQELLRIASRPDIISFALGLPAPELFPLQALAEAASRVFAEDAGNSFQYGPSASHFKQQIVELMALRGVSCNENQVFPTAGSQQGINLLAHLLLDPGGQVIAEAKIYSGARQVFEILQANVLTVPTDPETGMEVDAVEKLLSEGARPAFIYTIADGHNPLTVSMSLAKRVRLVELARQYQVPIIEDDPYGLLYYETSPLPPMRALDEEWVLYVGTFSKILAPTLRVGWLVLPETLIPKLSIVKEAADIDTRTFSQRIVSAYLDTGELEEHLSKLQLEYRLKRDRMLQALNCHFDKDAGWTKPSSGFFIWVEFSGDIDILKLLKDSIEKENVAFVPGRAFAVGNGYADDSSMRLSFSNNSLDQIDQGVERIAKLLHSSHIRGKS